MTTAKTACFLVSFAIAGALAQVHLTIIYPQIQATSSLSAQVARHGAGRLTLTVKPTDTLKRTTRLTARLNPS